MAKRRTLKKNIEIICSELFAECIAVSLYDATPSKENTEALLHSIIKLESNYICRISHVEPGMKESVYFRDLIEKFTNEVNDIVDQINNMH